MSVKKEFMYKILLLGDSSVGKTCILTRYSENTFQEEHMATIGLDFKIKSVNLNGKIVKVQIWDTAGQDRFKSITKNYYKGAHGIILIYDVSNPKTYDNIKKWLAQIKEEASSKVCIILVANKIDHEERVVTEEEGEKLAKSFNLKIFESSAKENINVTEAFQEVIENISVNYSNIMTGGTKLQNTKIITKEKKGCC
jgi:small GTP-binding protein